MRIENTLFVQLLAGGRLEHGRTFLNCGARNWPPPEPYREAIATLQDDLRDRRQCGKSDCADSSAAFGAEEGGTGSGGGAKNLAEKIEKSEVITSIGTEIQDLGRL
jgi:hypothetical protein